MDQAARDNNLSSFRVAKVMRFQLLKGKAKVFADTMVAMPLRYPFQITTVNNLEFKEEDMFSIKHLSDIEFHQFLLHMVK